MGTAAESPRRVLFLLPDVDTPPSKGYQVRCLGLAAGLSARYTARVVAARRTSVVDHIGADARPLRRLRSLVARVVDGQPLQSALFDGADVAHAFEGMLQEWMPHAVVVCTERLPVTAAACCGDRLVLDVVDSMRLHMRRRAERSRTPLRQLWEHEARSFARNAHVLRECAAAIIVASSTALDDYPGATVIPNAATASTLPRAAPTIDAIFTGNLAYGPNVEAAIEICTRVAPAIRAQLPDARIVVAGRTPRPAVRAACAASRVTLLPDVDDVDELLRSSRVALAPVAWTPAANLKIMEALAAGTPVVAYRAAARQLPTPTEGVGACDGPLDMARTAVAIISGREPARSFSRDAHTWSSRAAALEAVLDAVIGQSEATR